MPVSVAARRPPAQQIRMQAEIRGFGALRVIEAQTMHDGDLEAANTKDAPDRIKPVALEGTRFEDGVLTAELPPACWTMLRLAVG